MKDIYNEFLKSSTQDEFTTEKVNVISNCLLGNYNDNGDYVIPNNIVDELIAVKKVKKSVFKNSVFCGAFLVGYGEMVFEVTFQKNTVKEIAMSELFVLENEYKVNGYIQNTIRTRIATFTEKLDDFIEKTYEHFNIVMSDNDDKSVKEYKVVDEINQQSYINAKRNFNLNMAKLTKKDYNKLYKAYLTSRLELLKNLNTPYSLAILEKFNQEYAKIEKYFLQDQNYKAVSELLDKCIEDVSNVNPLFAKQEQEFIDKCKPIIDEFSGKATDIALKAHPKAMGELNKGDRTLNEELERELNDGKVTAKVNKEDIKPVKEESANYASNSTAPKADKASLKGAKETKEQRQTLNSEGFNHSKVLNEKASNLSDLIGRITAKKSTTEDNKMHGFDMLRKDNTVYVKQDDKKAEIEQTQQKYKKLMDGMGIDNGNSSETTTRTSTETRQVNAPSETGEVRRRYVNYNGNERLSGNPSVIVGLDNKIYVNKKDSPDKKHLENEYIDKESRKDEYFGPHI